MILYSKYRLSVFGAMQTAQCKWRNANGTIRNPTPNPNPNPTLTLRHLRCAVCITPNTESRKYNSQSLTVSYSVTNTKMNNYSLRTLKLVETSWKCSMAQNLVHIEKLWQVEADIDMQAAKPFDYGTV